MLDIINFYYIFDIDYGNVISFYYRPLNEDSQIVSAHIKVLDKYNIELCDIIVNNESNRNKGYGSELLKYIIDYVNQYHKKNIIGNIMERDEHEKLKLWYS